MNLKKKLKAFFTLKRCANEGFTLVELIVVIAILAILAGVAVPAYSGYIQKANITADKQLLADVNKAFVSACMVEGVDNFNRGDVSVTLSGEDGNKVIDSLTVSAVPNFDATFKGFYEGGEFKVVTELEYDAATGMFTAPELEEGDNGGGKFNQNAWNSLAGLKDIFQGSNYFNKDAEDGGISELTGTIDNLTNVLAFNDSVINALADMPAFKDTLKNLGIEGSTDKQELANAAVFFVADKLSGLNASEVYSNMKDNTLDTYLTQNGINPNNNEGLFVKTALQYGMIQAYVNSEYASETEKEYFKNNTPTGVTEAAGFIEHFTSEENIAYQYYISDAYGDGQPSKDVDAFLQILGAVGNNKDAFNSVSGGGLFSDSDLQGALKNDLLSKE